MPRHANDNDNDNRGNDGAGVGTRVGGGTRSLDSHE
jgi:hypothetical protein